MSQDLSHTPVVDAVQQQMKSIPGGQVTLRDDRISRLWTVEIAPFSMSAYPVTQDIYEAVMQVNPSVFKGERLPVENVSWKDAVMFCQQLSIMAGLSTCYTFEPGSEDIIFDQKANGYRLPTEAEWQYACMAGTPGTRYGKIDEIAWYKENSGQSTHEAGLKIPNAWELYDMLGNVWEWCSDIYDKTVYGTYRIFRGGGWADEERGCMATNRRRSHPLQFSIDDLGFRIARSI